MYPKYLLGISRKSDKTQNLSNGVKQTPDCCSDHTRGSCTPQLLCLAQTLLHSPAWQVPGVSQTIQVFVSLDLLSCTLQECHCHVSLELARLAHDLSPHWSFMSCLTWQIPSGLSQLWGCALNPTSTKGTHQELFASKNYRAR